ncbi:unnamed protein product [Calypogeia fissa]
MAEALLPKEVLRTVDDLSLALQMVEEQLSCVLPRCTRESFEQSSFVERASTFSSLSKALTVLFTVYLKTNGISPDDHPSSSEMRRIDLYQDKVQKAVDRSTGPRSSASSLDVKAANRFIEHAIPDLPEEQKRAMRELSKRRAPDRQHERAILTSALKKRSSGLTLAEEAAAFLAETREEASITREGEAFNGKD